MTKLISVIVPVFNNSETLKKLDQELRQYLKKIEFEIIYVNDDSSDNSEQIIKELCNSNQNTKLINLEKNYGQEGAVKAGLTLATGEYALSFDADLQDPPEILNEILRYIDKKYDVIIAGRNSVKENLFKKISSKIHHYIIKRLIPNYPSNGFNIWCMSKKFYSYIKENEQINLPIDVFHFTKNIKIFYYDRRIREFGNSQSIFINRLDHSLLLISSISQFPLRICLTVGFFLFLLAFAYIFLIVIGYFINPNIPNFAGWSPIMILILLFGSLSLFFIGIIGEYLFVAIKFLRNRKKFFIKNIYKDNNN